MTLNDNCAQNTGGHVFCKHNWELISETTTKSAFEIASESGNPFTGIKSDPANAIFRRYHIQVLQCTKCGKLKRFCEEL